MKKLAVWIGLSILLYLVLCGVSLRFSPQFLPSVKRIDILRIQIEILGGILTFSAVLWALFGDSIRKSLQKSDLDFETGKEDSYCCFIKDEVSVADLERTRLGICIKIINRSSVVATGCQLVSNEILASSDGIKFSKLKGICTAAFKWVYEDGYETTIQIGIDKFIRVVDIVKDVTKPGVVPGGASRVGSIEQTSIEVRVPDHITNKGYINLGTGYKGVMFPVKLVSKTEELKIRYIQVIWQGSDLKDFRIADKLKIRCLTETEAAKDIA